ncbi:hypothetical protein ACTU45_08545 [Streptomyces sp. 24-1644]
MSPLRDGDTLVVVEDPALAALELRCLAEGLCVPSSPAAAAGTSSP